MLYLLPLTGLLATARAWVMVLAVVVTVVTGVDYVVRALHAAPHVASGRR